MCTWVCVFECGYGHVNAGSWTPEVEVTGDCELPSTALGIKLGTKLRSFTRAQGLKSHLLPIASLSIHPLRAHPMELMRRGRAASEPLQVR